MMAVIFNNDLVRSVEAEFAYPRVALRGLLWKRQVMEVPLQMIIGCKPFPSHPSHPPYLQSRLSI